MSDPLLRDFTRNRSDEVFRALVRQHSPVVYNTALRRLRGDRAAAQDVTQEVFTLLARKASRLENVVLSGWLYRQACRRSANHMRQESRRRSRERAAAETMEATMPADVDVLFLVRELDDALLTLPAADRNALLLRYFEGLEYRAVGQSLGLSEEAARKRIRRSLDRLGDVFKRKGLVVSGGTLGTALEGMGATVPASVVSQISLPAVSGTAGLVPLLYPLAAGVIATSLAAGSALALRPDPPAKSTAAPAGTSVVARHDRTPRLTEKLPENPTLEQIIAEIRRVRSSPANVLTSMRLRVALDKIGIERIPEFIALAMDRLNKAEQEGVFFPLLRQWMERESDAALTFMLTEKIDERNGSRSTYLVGEFFRQWAERDPAASEAWLLRNWDHETLATPHSGGCFRNFLSMWVSGDLFKNQGAAAVFAFASRLPTDADGARSLQALAGMAPMHTMWSYSEGSKELWREFYRGLERFPDNHWRGELTRGFWKNTGQNQPDKLPKILDFIQPSDEFAVALGLLAVKSVEGKPVETLSGGFSMNPSPVADRDQRLAAAMEAGLASGLSRGETLAAMGETLINTMTREEFIDWLDSHRAEVELDDLLSAKARDMAESAAMVIGEEMDAIAWASRISDPDLRLRVCRGAFRRLLAHRPDSARSYLEVSGPPADLAAEFQAILNESP